MVILHLYDILKTDSDENHRLTQRQLTELLKSRYGETGDRKTIRKDLALLAEQDPNIQYDDSRTRIGRTGEEESLTTAWYYSHDFTGAELRLLIDSLLFSKEIPYSQCRELVGKLKGLSSRYFDAKVNYIRNLPEDQPDNQQLFYTIDVLDEAISSNRQVAFHYCEYQTDRQLHERRNSEGKVREYIINPYQIAATNGRYYLICNYDKYDNISYYRLELIREIRVLAAKRKPLKSLPGQKNGLDLPKHMAEHIYMMSGPSVHVKFRAEKHLLSQIIDWFGKDIRFSDETDTEVTVTVNVNEDAMFFWLMQYGEYTEVLEPGELRQRVQQTLKNMSEVYN